MFPITDMGFQHKFMDMGKIGSRDLVLTAMMLSCRPLNSPTAQFLSNYNVQSILI